MFKTAYSFYIPCRKTRTLTGLTNRPRSVPLGDGVDPLPNPDDSTEHSNSAVGPFPESVTKNRRMFKRIENVRSSLSEYLSPSETWNSHSGSHKNEALRRSVRDKILKRHLNVKPILRTITTAEGFIPRADLRQALHKMNLDLTEDELNCCCGADEKINAAAFVKSLAVPEYDYGSYDPLGDSSRREVSWLSHTQRAWKEKMHMQATNGMKQLNQETTTTGIESLPPRTVNAEGSKWSRSELRKVSDITRRLESVGVPVFSLLKEIDQDGSGNVNRGDFEGCLKRSSNFGMIKGQVNELWEQADKQGTKTLNFLDLQDAVKTMESKAAAQQITLSASQLSRDGSGSQPPWADLHTTRSPYLPSCHYNVRSRKAVAPRNTCDIIVPLESSFSYCPDWMRSTSVRLDNSWLVDGTGQGVTAKNRNLAKLERKREAESRIKESVQRRETHAENQDAARLNGIARVRHDWIASMQGIWA